MCDGPYLVHVRNPGTAPPNLAGVQELAAGMLRIADAVVVDQAEVWVDDIRLDDVVREAGLAGALDLRLTAANFADVTLNLYRRDGNFRQLGDDPGYVTENSAAAGATVRLERFLPDRWRESVAIPFTVRHGVAESDPDFLSRTDLRARALGSVRIPRARTTSYAMALRRTAPSGTPLGRWLLDPLGLSASYSAGDARSDLSSGRSSSHAITVDYHL